MKIEQQVCSMEQGQIFQQFGIIGHSYFVWWFNDPQYFLDSSSADFDNPHLVEVCPAFSVAELGIMLPDEIKSEHIYSMWIDERFGEPGRQFTTSMLNVDMQQGWESEAECRADLLIYLLENKLTSASEVNKRLSQ